MELGTSYRALGAGLTYPTPLWDGAWDLELAKVGPQDWLPEEVSRVEGVSRA